VPNQRLYLDESGDHTTRGFRASQWDKRYLCLFGCSFDLQMCHKSFSPQFEDFKVRHFGGDQDDPVILHREDVKARRGRFGVLVEADACAKFNKELLEIVSKAPFRAFAVVIDKLSTAGKDFGPISAHPYHIGLLTLLERYCGWLKLGKWTGDVLAESRGGREDEQLKAAYVSVHTGGTNFHKKEFFQKQLSSKEIKIKPKSQNINPLQLADLLAYPAKRRILWDFNRGPEPTGFTADLAEAIEKKYNRRYADDQVVGYGKIMIT